MERKLPKNVRQIGNVSDNPKIYIEDYVDTFLMQLCEQTEEEPQGAFLIGDVHSEEGQDYIFIYGAIRMYAVKKSGNELAIGEEVWKRAYEDCKQYFEDGEMLGCFLTMPGGPLTVTAEMKKIHKKSFPKKNSVLILEDPIEHEESYYANKYNELMHISGHYVYYEKNPCMQNYMISCRKKNGVTPSETVEDRAAKDFRSLVRTREEAKEQKKITRFLYVASSLLILVVIAMGVTTINNFDKMKSVQNSLESLGESTQASSGNVKAEEKNPTGEDLEAGTAVDEAGEDEQTAAEAASATDNVEVQGIADNTAVGDAAAGAADAGVVAAAEGDAATSDANGSNGVYVVEQGDTLAMISQKCYGDVSHVDAICRMNGLSDGNLIYIGQKLLLP